MKLIRRIDQYSRKSESRISISESGVIRISGQFVKALKLKVGQHVAFYQDEEKPQDWYLKQESEGITLRKGSGDTQALMCNSSSIAKSILNSIGKSNKTNMRIATEPIDDGYYAIITKSAT